MKASKQMETKLFKAGLILLLCSPIFAVVIQFHATFFKVQRYKSLSQPQQQQWWYKLIDLQQSSEYFRSPTAQVLLFLAIGSALLGFVLMILSSQIAKRRSNEETEQWFKDNLPQKQKKKRRK